jgi:hypothetical protein
MYTGIENLMLLDFGISELIVPVMVTSYELPPKELS